MGSEEFVDELAVGAFHGWEVEGEQCWVCNPFCDPAFCLECEFYVLGGIFQDRFAINRDPRATREKKINQGYKHTRLGSQQENKEIKFADEYEK
jgi:hypothetical protein